MKIRFIFILEILLLTFLLFGCTDSNAPKNPEKISFSYSSGAMHLDWGSFEIIVDEEGNGTYYDRMGMSMELEKKFTLTKEEMREVFDIAAKNGFYSLNDSYNDPSIMDGGWNKLSITTDDYTKTVNLSNYNLPQFSEVSSKIYSLANEKLGANGLSNNFKDYCPEKKIECNEFSEEQCNALDSSEKDYLDCYDCVEWEEYCEWGGKKFVANVEICNLLENRVNCIDYCLNNICVEAVCDALMFEADECTQCSPGCCSLCSDLDSCTSGFICIGNTIFLSIAL